MKYDTWKIQDAPCLIRYSHNGNHEFFIAYLINRLVKAFFKLGIESIFCGSGSLVRIISVAQILGNLFSNSFDHDMDPNGQWW